MSGPAPRDLWIYRGDDYTHEVAFTDDADPPQVLDVSAYTFTAEIRPYSGRSADLLASFQIDAGQAAAGVIVLSLEGAATRPLTSGVWDLQADNGTSVTTWLAGKVTVEGDVTR